MGVAVIVSWFPEGGDVYLLSLPEHLHVKKAQFLCGQDLSDPHFLLDRAECWRGVQVKDKATSGDLPSHLIVTVPSLTASTVPGRPGGGGGVVSVTLCRVAAGGRAQIPRPAAGSVGCEAQELKAVPLEPVRSPYLERQFSVRGTKHINISPHVTDLNIDNDFKGKKKLHVLLYLQVLPSSSNKHRQRGTIANQSDVKGEEGRWVSWNDGCDQAIAVSLLNIHPHL